MVELRQPFGATSCDLAFLETQRLGLLPRTLPQQDFCNTNMAGTVPYFLVLFRHVVQKWALMKWTSYVTNTSSPATRAGKGVSASPLDLVFAAATRSRDGVLRSGA